MTTAFPPPCDEASTPGEAATAGDRGSPARAAGPPPGDADTGTLVATVLGSSLAFIVGAIINVALPSIQADFGAGAGGAQWIVNAYLLPLGALVLLGGALGDHYGRKRMFLAGLAVFSAGCVACALAPGLAWLLAARVVQGLGAALLTPNSLSIIAAGFSGEARGKAVGTWAAAGAMAGAGAPLLGGWIVDAASWRWAFVVVLPVALLAFVVGLRAIAESREHRDAAAPLDWAGAALATAALAALVWAMIAAPTRGFADPAVIAVAVLGVLLAATFLHLERRKGSDAMMPLVLFATSNFVGISLLTFWLYAALGGLIVLLPYMLITAFGFSASLAGAAILPFPLVLGVLSRLTGGLATRIGLRVALTAGPVAVAAGFGLLSRVPAAQMSYWTDILPGLLVMALGMAMSVAPLTTAVMNSVSDDHVGVASGVNNATARIAGLVATALLGPVLIDAGPDGATLVAGFGVAALVGAGLALASAAASWTLIAPQQAGRDAGD